MKTTNNYRFTNWAGTYSSTTEQYLQPETESELVEIIHKANTTNKKIRLVGAGHSWSPIVLTNHLLVNLDNYTRVLNIDKDKFQITVQAGIRLKDLNIILEANDMALTNLGSVSEQSVAGAISTGTHGTGIGHGVIATQAVALTLITGTGELVSLNAEDGGELWQCVPVSMGCLGIISTVTLQCSKAFKLEENAYPLKFNTVIEQLPELIKQQEHMKLWWFPHVDNVQVYCFNKTNKKTVNTGRLIRWIDELFLAKYVFGTFLFLTTRYPKLTPKINALINKIKFNKEYRVDKSYRVFNTPMPPKHREAEYAIPAENTGAALQDIKDMIETKGLFINFLLEARFVKADDMLLSPAYGRDSCFIGAYKAGNAGWGDYLEGFEAIMKKYNGRPHWGKEFTIKKDEIKNLYPKFDAFLKVREQLDPNKIFTNQFIKDALS